MFIKVVDLNKNIIKILRISIFVLLSFSCSKIIDNRAIENGLDSIHLRSTATEEEISVINSVSSIDYEKCLNSAYRGDKESVIQILELRANKKIVWDGAASDSYSDNIIKVMYKIGDFKFYKIIYSETKLKHFNWANVFFPSGDDGLVIGSYIKLFPRTYKWCLSCRQ